MVSGSRREKGVEELSQVLGVVTLTLWDQLK